jgi:membrane-associated phospholipid phosphatase
MFGGACALTVLLVLQSPADTGRLAQAPPSPGSTSATTPAAADRPFQDLISNLGRDMRALPSANNALILGIGGGGAVVVRPLDDNISGWAGKQGPSGYADIGDVAGNGWVQAGGAVATYALGVATHSRKTTHVGSDLIRGQFLTGIFTQVLKVTVQRHRPDGGHRSFPSGHTSAAFLTAAVLDGNFGAKAAVPAYAGAAFIAWTRLRENQHWLTDAIGGATIGIIVGRSVAVHHASPHAWRVIPSPTAGGFSVSVVRN